MAGSKGSYMSIIQSLRHSVCDSECTHSEPCLITAAHDDFTFRVTPRADRGSPEQGILRHSQFQRYRTRYPQGMFTSLERWGLPLSHAASESQ
jgi:hypothetical protein